MRWQDCDRARGRRPHGALLQSRGGRRARNAPALRAQDRARKSAAPARRRQGSRQRRRRAARVAGRRRAARNPVSSGARDDGRHRGHTVARRPGGDARRGGRGSAAIRNASRRRSRSISSSIIRSSPITRAAATRSRATWRSNSSAMRSATLSCAGPADAFENMRVVPPGGGICHQVNLEHLARVVCVQQDGAREARLSGFDGRHRQSHADDQRPGHRRLGRVRHGRRRRGARRARGHADSASRRLPAHRPAQRRRHGDRSRAHA